MEFKVKARDNAGNTGDYSAPVATQVVNQPPYATVNPLPDYIIDDNFTVSWMVTQPGLAPIRCYNLQFQLNGGDWQPLVNCTGATSYQVTGVSAAERYGFRVQAEDTVGNKQPWSTTAQAESIVVPYPVAVIDAFSPPIIDATSAVTNSFTVYWTGYTAPDTTITQYTLYFRYRSFAGTNAGWQVWKPFPGTTNSAPLWPAGVRHSGRVLRLLRDGEEQQEPNLAMRPDHWLPAASRPGQHDDGGSRGQAVLHPPADRL